MNQPSPKFLTVQPDGVTLALKVQPRASRNEIGPATGDVLRVRVTAPPVDAAANEAVLELLAERLQCRRGDLQILRGHTSRLKIVKVFHASAEKILRQLSA